MNQSTTTDTQSSSRPNARQGHGSYKRRQEKDLAYKNDVEHERMQSYLMNKWSIGVEQFNDRGAVEEAEIAQAHTDNLIITANAQVIFEFTSESFLDLDELEGTTIDSELFERLATCTCEIGSEMRTSLSIEDIAVNRRWGREVIECCRKTTESQGSDCSILARASECCEIEDASVPEEEQETPSTTSDFEGYASEQNETMNCYTPVEDDDVEGRPSLSDMSMEDMPFIDRPVMIKDRRNVRKRRALEYQYSVYFRGHAINIYHKRGRLKTINLQKADMHRITLINRCCYQQLIANTALLDNIYLIR